MDVSVRYVRDTSRKYMEASGRQFRDTSKS